MILAPCVFTSAGEGAVFSNLIDLGGLKVRFGDPQ